MATVMLLGLIFAMPATSAAGAPDAKPAATEAPAAKPAESPPSLPKTPEDAVTRLAEAAAGAAKDGASLEPVLVLLDTEAATALRELCRLSGDVAKAQARLVKALEAKFPGTAGKAGGSIPDFGSYEADFRRGLAGLGVLKLEVKADAQSDGRVLLTLVAERMAGANPAEPKQSPSTRRELFWAVPTSDGQWRLLPERLSDPATMSALRVQVAAYRKFPEVLEKSAREVEDNRYGTRMEAEQSATAALLGVLQNLQQRGSGDPRP